MNKKNMMIVSWWWWCWWWWWRILLTVPQILLPILWIYKVFSPFFLFFYRHEFFFSFPHASFLHTSSLIPEIPTVIWGVPVSSLHGVASTVQYFSFFSFFPFQNDYIQKVLFSIINNMQIRKSETEEKKNKQKNTFLK